MATNFPILYKLDKKDEIRYWEVYARGDTFYTRAGMWKKRDGHRWQPHTRGSRYEPGHGAYTDPESVAIEHAMSMWKEKKRKDAMTESIGDFLNADGTMALKRSYPIPIAPVLAMRYQDLLKRHENYLSYADRGLKPRTGMYCFPEVEYMVDTKLDGERATISWCKPRSVSQINDEVQEYIPGTLDDGDVHIFSRGRIEIPHCDHIKGPFRTLYKAWGKVKPEILGFHFDGEVIQPGTTRNKMRSSISRIKEKHVDNDKNVFYAFDLIMDSNIPYEERRRVLESMFSKIKSVCIKLVPSLGRVSLQDGVKVQEYMAMALHMGYEGIILRDPQMLYPTANLRINEMIKCKPLQDEEMRIIDAHEGIDAHAGLIIFRVEDTNDGQVKQDVTPAWTHEDRAEAWSMFQVDPSQFIGKLITVHYREKNEYGTLIEARAGRIRDRMDLSFAPTDKPHSFRHP